ncbi:neural cell adhesion molecule L1-like protein [Leptotrombidium deliense]|uniref:Neural cell adhesion molecule L1-like protein n=1 Tax=Leptotrombidium deliense TaxID=299467 RepID=A0A443SI04_9ACAR|nr:neural cell adhesion molecule L1-like protein [Leptotrombidium deliense]
MKQMHNSNIFENLRLPHNHRQKVYPNGTLVVTDLERLSDEGTYKCVAKNSESKYAQNSLYVIVLVRPEIEAFSFSSTLQQGQRYNTLCSVIKGDPPVMIEWHKNGRPITKASNDPQFAGINIAHVNEYSLSLSFDSLRPEHSGNYSCMANNVAGTVAHNATMVIHVTFAAITLSETQALFALRLLSEYFLIEFAVCILDFVTVPPKWRFEPIDVAVIKGRVAIIDCQADGFPPPRIRWSKAEDTALRIQSNQFESTFKGFRERFTRFTQYTEI